MLYLSTTPCTTASKFNFLHMQLEPLTDTENVTKYENTHSLYIGFMVITCDFLEFTTLYFGTKGQQDTGVC
jgi:hypothetical protein